MQTIKLSPSEAKLIAISLIARISRLNNKKRKHSGDLRVLRGVTADIARTQVLIGKISTAFGIDLAPRPPQQLTSYEQAVVDHGKELSEYILDPNS